MKKLKLGGSRVVYEWVISILFGIGGAISLWGLYRAMEISWPQQYVSLNDTFALRITQTWWRLFLYRSVPIFFGVLAVGVTTDRRGGFPVVAICVMVTLHLLQTNGRAILEAFGKLRRESRFTVNYASYHLVTIGVITLSALISALLLGPLAFLVPSPRVLLENLWIAVFVAIVGGAAIGVLGRRPSNAPGFDGAYFIDRATRDVGVDLIDDAYSAAVWSGADPILVRSIMFAEVLQRPAWVRNLERAKGLIIRGGSYGVTQEYSDKPISDREAIAKTAEKYSGAWAIQRRDGYWASSDDLIWKHAAQHNEDLAFIQGVQRIYGIAQRDYSHLPNFPSDAPVHLIELRRYPHEVGLRGLSLCDSVEFHYRPDGDEVEVVRVDAPNGRPYQSIWAFEQIIPIAVETVTMLCLDPSTGLPFTHTLRVNTSRVPLPRE